MASRTGCSFIRMPPAHCRGRLDECAAHVVIAGEAQLEGDARCLGIAQRGAVAGVGNGNDECLDGVITRQELAYFFRVMCMERPKTSESGRAK